MKSWKLSPSEFTFLWEECARCFYDKVAGEVDRPRTPMPKIFNTIDLLEKTFFHNKRTEEISPDLPPGRVEFAEKWVHSQLIQFDGIGSCYIRGRFDVGLKFDDGSFGVVDFKTANPKDDHIRLYSRQLHGYALALERAAPGKFRLSPVNVMGLLCVEPKHMAGFEGTNLLIGKAQWIPILRDDEAFEEFLREVVSLLAQPTPPPLNPNCNFCMYRSGPDPGQKAAQPFLPFLDRRRVRRAV